MAAAGGTGQAIFVTLTDTNAVKTALVDIIAKTVPPGEICNGLDDNCDGQIDEGVSNACRMCTVGSGIAACGSFTIAPNSKTDRRQRGRPERRRRPALRGRGLQLPGRQLQRSGRRRPAAERLRPALRLRACRPSSATASTTTATATSTKASSSARRASTTASAPAAAAASWPARPDKTGTFCDAPTVTPQTGGLQRHRRQLQRPDRRGDAARRRRQVRQRPGHLPVRDVRLHERPAGVQRDRHAAGRDLQRHRRQLRRRHRQRQLPADRSDLPLPGR